MGLAVEVVVESSLAVAHRGSVVDMIADRDLAVGIVDIWRVVLLAAQVEGRAEGSVADTKCLARVVLAVEAPAVLLAAQESRLLAVVLPLSSVPLACPRVLT